MGTLGYWRKQVPGFSIACPLHWLLQKGKRWSWHSEHEEAIKTLILELKTYLNYKCLLILDPRALQQPFKRSPILDAPPLPLAWDASDNNGVKETQYEMDLSCILRGNLFSLPPPPPRDSSLFFP